jgi:hypothetical protein
MFEEELVTEAREYEKVKITSVEEAARKLKKFLKAYPFRDRPDDIDLLTSDKIYNPGDKQTFLYWIEFGLRDLGHIRVGSALYAENARDNPEKFKGLLRTVVNDTLSVSQKIDAHWEDIKGWGGDRIIAKKILFCYHPEEVLPIFKTEDFEHFARCLDISFQKEVHNSYGKSYEILSIGQKFEVLNKAFIEFKSSTLPFNNWSNLLFAGFLYDNYPPQRLPTPVREVKPLHTLGILFEPEYEQEVVYLFSIFHRELDFPYIIKIRNEFPDALVMDKKRRAKRIEFEVKASDFIHHKHDKKGCDFIICWENDLEGNEDLPSIIALKDFVEELK